MRRVVLVVSAVIASLVLVSPSASAATRPLPVPYNFLPARDPRRRSPNATLRAPTNWTCKPSAEHPRPGGAGARHLRQPEHELADVRSAAEEQRLLRVRPDVRQPLPGLPFPVKALGGLGDIADERRSS